MRLSNSTPFFKIKEHSLIISLKLKKIINYFFISKISELLKNWLLQKIFFVMWVIPNVELSLCFCKLH